MRRMRERMRMQFYRCMIRRTQSLCCVFVILQLSGFVSLCSSVRLMSMMHSLHHF